MSAIQTRYIPPTSTCPARIDAWCEWGGVSVTCDEHPGAREHIRAAHALIASMNAANAEEFGLDAVIPGRGWNAEFASAQLPGGDYAHVFIPTVMRMPLREAFDWICRENPSRDVMLHRNGIAIRFGEWWQSCVSRLADCDGFIVNADLESAISVADSTMRNMYPEAEIHSGQPV